MFTPLFRSLRLTLALLACTAFCLHAQTYYGVLRGIVTDSTAGIVTAASVTFTNEGTTEVRTAVTSASGEFVFSEVIPATYAVTIEAPGFKKFTRSGIAVGTQQQISLDLKLEVGQVSETVQITEQAPLIESASASQGQLLDNQKLVELPNLGRNPFMLSKLAQNVIPVGNPAYNRMEDQSGSSSISIAGGPVRGNNYLVDGVPITDSSNRAIIIPSLEAVQEVTVQANTYSSEMARTGGGMFNTLMKSGTNLYHGSLYGHIRRTAMDANSFFNNAGGIPITNQPNSTWGASFGGRVFIPRSHADGETQTFFYPSPLNTTTTCSRHLPCSTLPRPSNAPAISRRPSLPAVRRSSSTTRLVGRRVSRLPETLFRKVRSGSAAGRRDIRRGSARAAANGAALLRRQRHHRVRQPACPRRAIHRQARSGFHLALAGQHQLSPLLLARTGQHLV